MFITVIFVTVVTEMFWMNDVQTYNSLCLNDGGFWTVVGRYLPILGAHQRRTYKIAKKHHTISDNSMEIEMPGVLQIIIDWKTTSVGNTWGLWSGAARRTKSPTLWLAGVSLWLSNRWLLISNKLVVLIFKTLFSDSLWRLNIWPAEIMNTSKLRVWVLQTERSTSVESTINISTQFPALLGCLILSSSLWTVY